MGLGAVGRIVGERRCRGGQELVMLVFEASGQRPTLSYVPAGYESYRFSCAAAMRRHFLAIGDLVADDDVAAASVAALDFEAICSEIEVGEP
jgi:hypothetical protein